ncbi:MAG: SUMF1/EgtB/PvdO family nonheme iron enzyme [Acidobacteriota bacterium]|nr:SUMF1/EgtB/PvdO family nonheme iron enzyme [Acidobacteriota bacterium]
MPSARSLIAAFLIFGLAGTNISGFRPDRGGEDRTAASQEGVVSHPARNIDGAKAETYEPHAIGGKSRSSTAIHKKKFPWLLAGGIVVIGVIAAVLILKSRKNKDSNQTDATTGSINCQSTPDGATVYLDGGDKGCWTDTTIGKIAPGNHTVTLLLVGYEDYTRSVTVKAGEIAQIDATLTALPLQEPEMVSLPGGTFMMGSDSAESLEDEKPVHQVTLSGFRIGKYEVTQTQWVTVMGSNPSEFQKDRLLLNTRGDRLPLDNVTYETIQVYIEKLNLATGKRYRLPTEAEWEYACRAGTLGDRYGEMEAIAWYMDNSDNRTHDIGGKTPNAYGLYDMLGNVFEWTDTWFGPYSAEPVTNPTGPYEGAHRCVRGGSFMQVALPARASHRNLHYPDHHSDPLGFRLALD